MGTGHGQGQEATTATIRAGPAQHLPEQARAELLQQNLPTKIV